MTQSQLAYEMFITDIDSDQVVCDYCNMPVKHELAKYVEHEDKIACMDCYHKPVGEIK